MRFTTLAEMFVADVTAPKTLEYLSKDGSVFLPAGRVFQQGPATDTSGWRFSDNLDTYGFIMAEPGQRVYVSSESEDITYSAKVSSDGTLEDLKPFAQRGGEGVAADENGNVYIANGQIFVYSPTGREIAQIGVPERPLQLVFGGADRKTLFILTHHTLYSARVR
jgi:SMP-30/gluconolaconase/LRE-like protein